MLSNLTLEFGPLKQVLIENGGARQLALLVTSMEPQVRLQSCWALVSLLFLADTRVKLALLERLPTHNIVALLHDSDSHIQEQALALLRNLFHKVSRFASRSLRKY